MNHGDVVQIFIAVGAAIVAILGSFVGWLWRHSTRLTRVEVRTDGVELGQQQDRSRNDAVWSDIRASLVRIEDKIDRKVDR